MFNRIAHPLQQINDDRFLVLYGVGIEDSYLNEDGIEFNLQQASMQNSSFVDLTRLSFLHPIAHCIIWMLNLKNYHHSKKKIRPIFPTSGKWWALSKGR